MAHEQEDLGKETEVLKYKPVREMERVSKETESRIYWQRSRTRNLEE
tara:strand:+ start:385 stop:525 length:141 start_codon:yes stop_codon:yes gene_type:complete